MLHALVRASLDRLAPTPTLSLGHRPWLLTGATTKPAVAECCGSFLWLGLQDCSFRDDAAFGVVP